MASALNGLFSRNTIGVPVHLGWQHTSVGALNETMVRLRAEADALDELDVQITRETDLYISTVIWSPGEQAVWRVDDMVWSLSHDTGHRVAHTESAPALSQNALWGTVSWGEVLLDDAYLLRPFTAIFSRPAGLTRFVKSLFAQAGIREGVAARRKEQRLLNGIVAFVLRSLAIVASVREIAFLHSAWSTLHDARPPRRTLVANGAASRSASGWCFSAVS